MLVLLGIGFVAGVITAISPCVLPVLPIVLAGGASGESRRRPFLIIGGLIVSFTFFTLAAASILSALGLPQDLLRNIAIALLFVLAATLFYPKLAIWLERPLAFMTRRRKGHPAGGFLLGISLGLVFVPCAGPVLATVTVLSAQHRIGLDTVLLTVAYAIGAGVPMLLIALGGQRISRPLRAGSENFRRAMGVVLAGAALAIVFNVDRSLQTRLGSYTNALQKHVEETKTARKHLDAIRGTDNRARTSRAAASTGLEDFGRAPAFAGISHWLNTPEDRPLSLAQLRGKVVLVDFWTYSCINCIRTLPHLRAWYAAYHDRGLEIVGVHTPEFAFEHELSNVRQATHDLHVTWPVALDNDYKTWTAYSNEYWPAEYFIDRTGRIRHVHFGEGEYGDSEQTIRTLLAQSGASLPEGMTKVGDQTPNEVVTPESYLGYERIDPTRYRGTPLRLNKATTYHFPATLPVNSLSYDGTWRITGQRAVAVASSRLRLRFHARNVFLVLGGHGTVTPLVDGERHTPIAVSEDKLYTLVKSPAARSGLLELRFTPGVTAYAFTFG
jgi:cytochrome c biogenesis protein CcdA/thiol-disulfide isomerase/thioredoxin